MNAASKPDNPRGWLACARSNLRIKAAFQRLAKMKAFSEIADPVQWQREPAVTGPYRDGPNDPCQQQSHERSLT